MPTETAPPPPTGPAVNIADLGSRGARPALPGMLEAARKAAGAPPSSAEPSNAPEPPKTPVTPASAPVAPAKEPVKQIAATPAAPAPPTDPKEKEAPKALRDALDRANAKLKELETSVTSTAKERADAHAKAAELEAKAAKYELDVEKVYKPQMQRLAEVEKKLVEREELIRIKDFTATEEWHNKYVRPIAEARAEAESLMAELIVTNEDGTQRIANRDDFDKVLAARSLNEAHDVAARLFGDRVSPSVVNLRSRVMSSERARHSAYEKAALESSEHEKRTQSQQAQFREQIRSKLSVETERLVAEFKPADDDTDGNVALMEGLALADLSMNGAPDMTADQFVGVVAKARARIAKSHVQDKRISKLEAENAELKANLKAFEKSEPDVQTRNGGSALPKTIFQEKMLQAARDAAQSR